MTVLGKGVESLIPSKEDAGMDPDVKRVLKTLDKLLENLPDELISEFSKTDDFKIYEKVLKKYRLME